MYRLTDIFPATIVVVYRLKLYIAKDVWIAVNIQNGWI